MFLLRLARQIGCTLDDLVGRLSWDELELWLAFDRIEPMPDPWLQTGVIAASNTNLWRGKKSRPVSPLDFMPRRKKKRQSPAEMRAAMAILRKPKE